jgi:hypothetical protein
MSIKVAGGWKSAGRGKVMSKSKRKRAHGRYLLNASREYAKAMERRDGLAGGAPPVRHIYNRERDGRRSSTGNVLDAER